MAAKKGYGNGLGQGSGLLASRIVPVAVPGQEADPVESELVKAARRISAVTAIRRLADGEEPASPPQPASIQDVIALNREAREASREQAEVAKEIAEEERRRREEAEERAESAFEAGQGQATSMYQTVLQMVQAQQATILNLMKDYHQAQLQQKDEEMKRILGEINAKVEAAIAAKDAEVRKLSEENQQLRQTLSQKKSLEDTLLEELKAGKRDGLLAALLGLNQQPQVPQDEDPNKAFQKALIPHAVEAVGLQMRKQAESLGAEERRKEERHQATLSVFQQLGQAIAEARSWIPTLMGATPMRRPDSAVPPGWGQTVDTQAQAGGQEAAEG